MLNISKISDFIKLYDLDIDKNLLKNLNEIKPYMDTAMTVSGNTSYRKCKNIWFNKDIIDNISLPDCFKETYIELDKKINELILNYSKDFDNCKQSLIGRHHGIHILNYTAGDYYNTHIDDFGESAFRRLSISIQLNDNFEGGEFEFFDSYRVKLQKNQGIVFPSSWIFPHQITPIISGERISVVTWVI
jgi:Rps23 Pro-64 3,4-dihydroxylase Tpa1-like proline 4-hydroxylase